MLRAQSTHAHARAIGQLGDWACPTLKHARALRAACTRHRLTAQCHRLCDCVPARILAGACHSSTLPPSPAARFPRPTRTRLFSRMCPLALGEPEELTPPVPHLAHAAPLPGAPAPAPALRGAFLQKSKMLELTYNVLPDATLASQLRLTRELANLEVALIKPMLEVRQTAPASNRRVPQALRSSTHILTRAFAPSQNDPRRTTTLHKRRPQRPHALVLATILYTRKYARAVRNPTPFAHATVQHALVAARRAGARTRRRVRALYTRRPPRRRAQFTGQRHHTIENALMTPIELAASICVGSVPLQQTAEMNSCLALS